ncbi:MAG: hypothetical protein EOM13_00435 [Clostridia bacterium]|nr:hypothetical protein [Eubacteriales bacterium]NCC47510.1 hypothetical protein [Clostridia bacterium]
MRLSLLPGMLILAAILATLFYRLLPCWLAPSSTGKMGPVNKEEDRGRTGRGHGAAAWQGSLSAACSLWLMRSGRIEPQSRNRFWLISGLAGIAVGVAAYLSGRPAGISGLIILLTWFLISRVVALQSIRLKKAFERDLFKIYRFVDLQLSSGVRLTDTLSGLADAAPGSPIRMFLQRFSAVYQLTFDLDQASSELRRLFPGSDMNLLTGHLEQTLRTGQTGRSLLRMENLLFARYFSCLQTESAALRRDLLWLALAGLTPTLAALLFPLLMSAVEALSTLFT